MNLAFPFLLLLLLIGPGYVFRTFSQRHEVRRSENISVSRATLSNQGKLAIQDLQQSLNASPWLMFSYFLMTWGGAFVAAKLWYWAVNRFAWEHVASCMSEHVRGHAPWYYLLKGFDYPESNEIEGAYVAATVDLGGKTYLYEGLLLDFQLGEDGALDRLILIEAERRLLRNDRQGTKDDDSRFYNISGHYFILKYAQITTLNVSYLVAVIDN